MTGKVLKRELRDRYSDLAESPRPEHRAVAAFMTTARKRSRVMIGNWLSTLVPEPGARRRLGLATGIYNIGTGMFLTCRSCTSPRDWDCRSPRSACGWPWPD